MSELDEYIVSIMHQHPSEDMSVSVGMIKAVDHEDAYRRSEFWRGKKRKEGGCNLAGRECIEDVREAYTGLKSTMLACSAEEIDSAA